MEIIAAPEAGELTEAEINKRFLEIADQLSEESELLSTKELEELEITPVLKPSGRSDQGWRED